MRGVRIAWPAVVIAGVLVIVAVVAIASWGGIP